MNYYQGSEASTSKGIENAFEKTISRNNYFKKKKELNPSLGNVEYCILFD